MHGLRPVWCFKLWQCLFCHSFMMNSCDMEGKWNQNCSLASSAATVQVPVKVERPAEPAPEAEAAAE